MEGKIDMAARRQVTNKLRDAYRKSSKVEKGQILDRVIATTGLARSSARRYLTGPKPPDPSDRVDRRALKPRGYGDDTRMLLEHVWKLMGMPCGKYLAVMRTQWLPLLDAAGDLDKPYATAVARAELSKMSAATIDRYLKPARDAMRLRGISTTKPANSLRTSIKIRTVADERDDLPGAIEADTVAHCGPTFIGEFARTLTMTDMPSGWTENASIRNNVSRWITQAVGDLENQFPFPLRSFDSDNGSEFINERVAAWFQERDIAQTRSRPYRKNDQATVESKNNHVVRKHAFYWRYDTPAELDLLNELWPLVSLRMNFFTPTRKPIDYTTTADGRRRRVYDNPATPWQRVQAAGILTDTQIRHVEQRIAGVNPADLTRQINHVQTRLTEIAQAKTDALAASKPLDLESLEPSINRLATKNRKPSRAHKA